MWNYSILREGKNEFKKGKKRILYYTSSIASGGAERQLIYTALAAEREGYEVKIVVDYPICHYDDMLVNSGVSVLCTNTTGYTPFKRFFLLSKLLWEYRPHVIHSFLSMRNLWGIALGKLYGVPVKIASIRSVNSSAFTATRIYRRWADYIICNTQTAAEIANKKYGVSEDKLKVVYNAIDYNRFHHAKPLPNIKNEIGLDSSTKLAVVVGRLTEEKNHSGMVEAINLLNNQGLLENIHFIFVGRASDESLAATIKKQISDSGLTDKVSFLGFRADVPEVLKACDFMVLPSLFEGFPNVVLEAMAAGVFVIASPTGGTPELVKNKENGLLSKSPNPEDLAYAIKWYLLAEPMKIEEMRNNATQWAKTFDVESSLKEVLDLYYSLP